MKDNDMIALWKSYGQKLDESLILHRQAAEAITGMKVQSLLASMRPAKVFALIVGIVWVGFVDFLLVKLFAVANPFFLISAGIQALLTKLALGIYIYQLITIHQVDVSNPIVDTQEKIARLKSSTIWVARILFLQLPLWTTFYWNENMLEKGNNALYLIQALVTGGFTFLAGWFFRNLHYKNRDKKWFAFLFKGKEWEPMIKAMALLSQVEEYRAEAKGAHAI